jgi:hypothetical protein
MEDRNGKKGPEAGRSIFLYMTMFRYHVMLIFLVGMMVSSASGNNQDQVDFSSYQWKNRLLILFAPSEDAPAYQSFKEQLQRRTREIRDRDLITFHVLESGKSRMDSLPLSREQALSLRRRFSIERGQCKWILIGKDGEEKLRGELPADLSDIFSVIDAMPMRQREMRERS